MYDADKVRANTADYLSQGRCPRCGGRNPVEPGFKRCRPCALRESESRRRQRERYWQQGRCPSCGHKREDPEFKTCRSCRGKSRMIFAAKKNNTQKAEVQP